MSKDRHGIEAESSLLSEFPHRTRSAVTNHKDLLPDLRSASARRFRDLVNARLASTTVQAEMLEARMVNGEAVDIASLCTLASTTVRLSQRLGLERRARTVTPSLNQYLAGRAPTNGDADSIDGEGIE